MTKAINLRLQQEEAVVWFTNANTTIDRVKVVVGSCDHIVCDLSDVKEAFTINLTFKEFEYFLMHANQQAQNVKEYLQKKEPKAEMSFGEEPKKKKVAKKKTTKAKKK